MLDMSLFAAQLKVRNSVGNGRQLDTCLRSQHHSAKVGPKYPFLMMGTLDRPFAVYIHNFLRRIPHMGGTVVQGLALSHHSEKVLGLIPGWGRAFLCGVCMFYPCSHGFSPDAPLSPTISTCMLGLFWFAMLGNLPIPFKNIGKEMLN